MTCPKRVRYGKIKIRRKMVQSLSLSLVHCHLKDRKKSYIIFFLDGSYVVERSSSEKLRCLTPHGLFGPAGRFFASHHSNKTQEEKESKKGKTYLNICYPYLLISSCNLKKFNSCCSFSKLFKTSIVSSII